MNNDYTAVFSISIIGAMQHETDTEVSSKRRNTETQKKERK